MKVNKSVFLLSLCFTVILMFFISISLNKNQTVALTPKVESNYQQFQYERAIDQGAVLEKIATFLKAVLGGEK